MKVLFRCDGGTGKRIGTGHVYRCLDLAERLRSEGIESAFLMRGEEGYQTGMNIARMNRFGTYQLPEKTKTSKQEARYMQGIVPEDGLVVLNRSPVQKGLAERLRGKVKTWVFSFFDDVDVNADYVLNGFVGFQGNIQNRYGSKIYCGPDYFPGNVILEALHKQEREPHDKRRIFVTTGGEDRHDLNLRIIGALEGIEQPFQATVVLGPASKYSFHQEQRLNAYGRDPRFKITPRLGRGTMLKQMHEADLAISAAGDTAYELACLGVPAIYICQAPHQLKTARAFQERGAGLNLGYGPNVSNRRLYGTIRDVLSDEQMLQKLSQNGKQLVDGKGTHRIVNKIIKILEKNDK